jgi:Ca2+-binding RTX toxin-like protein
METQGGVGIGCYPHAGGLRVEVWRMMRRTVLLGACVALAMLLVASGVALAKVINGTNQADTLKGTNRADTIRGRGGNDKLYGLGGLDRMHGGFGADQMLGDDGPDGLNGITGADTLRGGAGNDTIYGGQSANVELPDQIGDKRADKLYGGGGNDLLWPGSGYSPLTPETCKYGRVYDVDGTRMDGGEGDDSVYGQDIGDDTLIGGVGADTLRGGTCRDVGKDVFYGGDGPDTIYATDYRYDGDMSFDIDVRDVVNCGGGVDTAHVEPRVDVVAADCENVIPENDASYDG